MSYVTVARKDGKNLYVIEIINGKRVKSTVEFRQTVYDYLDENDKRRNRLPVHQDVYGKECVEVKLDNGKIKRYRDYKYNTYGKSQNIFCGDIDSKYQYIAENYPGEIEYNNEDFVKAYIDIETSMTAYNSRHEIRIRKKDRSQSPVSTLMSELWGLKEQYECFDEEISEWTAIDKSCYFKNSGFPDPFNPDKEIVSIAYYNSGTKKQHVFGLKKYTGDSEEFQYHECEDEAQLLHRFWYALSKSEASIVATWNGDRFDIPFLVTRSFKIIGEDETKKYFPLGKWIEKPHKDVDRTIYIDGWVFYDLLCLYKKYNQTREESYSLDSIAKKILGEGKLDYHSKYRTLTELYHDNYNQFIEYNMRDTMVMVELEAKNKHIDLSLKIAYMMKILPEDIYSNTKAWDVKIYNLLRERGIVIPKSIDKEDAEGDSKKYTGAYVAEPQIGKFKDTIIYDVNSLYPNIMIAFNMTPWTHIGKLDSLTALRGEEKDKNDRIASLVQDDEPILSFVDEIKKLKYTLSPSGDIFMGNEMDPLLKEVKRIFDHRISLKKKSEELKKKGDSSDETDLLDMEAQAIKIVLNSLYGAFGAKYFRYFKRDVAESVTLAGQYIIRKIAKNVDTTLNEMIPVEKTRVISSDTDSIFVNLSSFTDAYFSQSGKVKTPKETVDFMNKLCEKFVDVAIADTFTTMTDSLNCVMNPFKMSREKVCSGVFVYSKKMYGLRIDMKDGKFYPEPKMEYKGLQVVRTTTPMVIRKILKDYLDYILSPDSTFEGLVGKIKEFRNKHDAMSVTQIAYPASANKMKKYDPADPDADDLKDSKKTSIGKKVMKMKKGTPAHMKAGWVYNNYLKRTGKDSDYPLILDRDKIKWVYLKTPNPFSSRYPVIAFFDIYGFPGEGDHALEMWVDRAVLFQKTFIKPLDNICKKIGWDIVESLKPKRKSLFTQTPINKS